MAKKLPVDGEVAWNNTDEQRLVRIETQMVNLTAVIAQSEQSRAKWEDKVEQRLENISSSNAADWKVIFAGISLIILIATLTLAPIYAELSAHKVELKEVIARQQEHYESGVGHQGTLTELKNLKDQVLIIDQEGSRKWVGRED